MITPRIVSNADPEDPRPWAELELRDGSLDITVVRLNGVAAHARAAAAREGRTLPAAALQRLSNAERGQARHALKRSPHPDRTDEVHVLAVTLDGDLEFVPESEQRDIYYAHLAWYHPATGEWARLQFVEG